MSNELCISDGSIMTQLYLMVSVTATGKTTVTRCDKGVVCDYVHIIPSINGRRCYTFARQTNMKHEF